MGVIGSSASLSKTLDDSYNVKTAQAEAAYANTAASDGALWESIAEAKHRASQWTSADDLLFARADEARDNAAEVVRVQALGLAAVERTQSLGDADVAQVTAIQDAKLASTRSAAASNAAASI